MIKINIIPLTLTDSKKLSPLWIMKRKMSNKELFGYKEHLERLLSDEMPVRFTYDTELTVSVKKDLSYKIDYSKLKTKRQKKIVQFYIEGNHFDFAKEWIKLA